MSVPRAADTPTNPLPNPLPVKGIAAIVGFLVCVELASGVLQGYYLPIFTDIVRHLGIRDADVNWFEGAQLVVAALVVPLLAQHGDLIGHRKDPAVVHRRHRTGGWPSPRASRRS